MVSIACLVGRYTYVCLCVVVVSCRYIGFVYNICLQAFTFDGALPVVYTVAVSCFVFLFCLSWFSSIALLRLEINVCMFSLQL